MEGTNDNKHLTDLEFDILDELYFISTLDNITDELSAPEEAIIKSLKSLVSRNLVKISYPDPDTTISYNEAEFDRLANQYYFLATKSGLIAHNSR